MIDTIKRKRAVAVSFSSRPAVPQRWVVTRSLLSKRRGANGVPPAPEFRVSIGRALTARLVASTIVIVDRRSLSVALSRPERLRKRAGRARKRHGVEYRFVDTTLE